MTLRRDGERAAGVGGPYGERRTMDEGAGDREGRPYSLRGSTLADQGADRGAASALLMRLLAVPILPVQTALKALFDSRNRGAYALVHPTAYSCMGSVLGGGVSAGVGGASVSMASTSWAVRGRTWETG